MYRFGFDANGPSFTIMGDCIEDLYFATWCEDGERVEDALYRRGLDDLPDPCWVEDADTGEPVDLADVPQTEEG